MIRSLLLSTIFMVTSIVEAKAPENEKGPSNEKAALVFQLGDGTICRMYFDSNKMSCVQQQQAEK
jgi:hypothetical protein